MFICSMLYFQTCWTKQFNKFLLGEDSSKKNRQTCANPYMSPKISAKHSYILKKKIRDGQGHFRWWLFPVFADFFLVNILVGFVFIVLSVRKWFKIHTFKLYACFFWIRIWYYNLLCNILRCYDINSLIFFAHAQNIIYI